MQIKIIIQQLYIPNCSTAQSCESGNGFAREMLASETFVQILVQLRSHIVYTRCTAQVAPTLLTDCVHTFQAIKFMCNFI